MFLSLIPLFVVEDKRTHSLLYRQYPYFAKNEGVEDIPGEVALQDINRLIEHGDFTQARSHAKELIEHALEGLRYLQTYAVFLRLVLYEIDAIL